jgi:molybdopterin molybdotransferase
VPATTRGRFVRQIGDELRRGEPLLDEGVVLDAAAIAILASDGRRDVAVSRQPRVNVWSTGAELRVAGEPRAPGEIYDSNGPALAALCAEAGAAIAHRGMLGDDRGETTRALTDVRHAELVLVSGGVSVGEHDHVRPAIEAAGGDVLLWRVAMKPGKPLLLARIGATPVIGLPGNPVSAQVAFRLFVRPLLRAMLGASPADDLVRATVTLAAPLAISTDRPTYLRAHVRPDGDRWVATLSPRQGSAALTSLVSTNALVVVEPGEHTLPAAAKLPALLY